MQYVRMRGSARALLGNHSHVAHIDPGKCSLNVPISPSAYIMSLCLAASTKLHFLRACLLDRCVVLGGLKILGTWLVH